jgi:hypothetical protein
LDASRVSALKNVPAALIRYTTIPLFGLPSIHVNDKVKEFSQLVESREKILRLKVYI